MKLARLPISDHNLGVALSEIRALATRGSLSGARARAKQYVTTYGGLSQAVDAMMQLATRPTMRRAAHGRWIQSPRQGLDTLHTVISGELTVFDAEGRRLGMLGHGSSHDLLELWGGPRSGRGLRAWTDSEVLELEAHAVRRFVLALPRLTAALDLATRHAWYLQHWPKSGPLGSLSPTTQAALFAEMDLVSYRPGEVIFQEGTVVPHMLFLVDGWAVDERRRVMGAGRALGVLGKPARAPLTLRARSTVRALVLAADEAAEIIAA
jgi:CRP-like cAMP-binding protein